VTPPTSGLGGSFVGAGRGQIIVGGRGRARVIVGGEGP
jgi:hypothetical protein